MDPTTWTGTHDRLLTDAVPDLEQPSAADLERVWSEVERTIADGRRQRRVRLGIAAGVGAVVLGTSGLAAAGIYSARTGDGPQDAEDLRLGGPGERLALAAPDYGEVIAEETKDIPFPTAADRAFALGEQIADAERAGTDEFVSTGAVRAWVADQALCSWSNQWAAATRDGDEAGRAEAIAMIQQAPTWPAVTAIDPEPFSRMRSQEVQGEDGVVRTERYRDESQFYYLAELGDAVEGRDLGAVARVLADNNGFCRAGNVPDLPRATPMSGER